MTFPIIDQWAARITAARGKSVPTILAVGVVLLEAQKDLKEQGLPFNTLYHTSRLSDKQLTEFIESGIIQPEMERDQLTSALVMARFHEDVSDETEPSDDTSQDETADQAGDETADDLEPPPSASAGKTLELANYLSGVVAEREQYDLADFLQVLRSTELRRGTIAAVEFIERVLIVDLTQAGLLNREEEEAP
jgi:hypothetical protein